MNKEIILVTEASGQLGTVLTEKLQEKHGIDNVLALDLRFNKNFNRQFEVLDVTNFEDLKAIVLKYYVTQIYHLAAILSANGEKNPLTTWDINMKTFFNVLEVSILHNIKKVFFPKFHCCFG